MKTKAIRRCLAELANREDWFLGHGNYLSLMGYGDWFVELEYLERIMKTFAEIGKEVGELVEQKNAAYGSAFQVSGEILKHFFPRGVSPDKYQDLLLIARIIDKLMRIASRKDAFGESPYIDIVGYAILGAWDNQPNEQPAPKQGTVVEQFRLPQC